MKPDYNFRYMTCAICGDPIDLTKWYALILDSKVHHPCFQAARGAGFNVSLLPNCIVNNLTKTNKSDEGLPHFPEGPTSGKTDLQTAQLALYNGRQYLKARHSMVNNL